MLSLIKLIIITRYLCAQQGLYLLIVFVYKANTSAISSFKQRRRVSHVFRKKMTSIILSKTNQFTRTKNFIEQKVPTKSSQMPKQQQSEQEKGTGFWELDWTQSQIKDQSQLTRPSVLPSLVFSPHNVMKLRQSIPTNLFIYPYQAAVCLCSLHGSFTLWETPTRDSLEVCWNK